MMKCLFLTIIFVCILPLFAHAQSEGLDIVSEPICFNVRNDAPYGVLGSFITAQYVDTKGRKVRHSSNFRFKAKGSVDEQTGAYTDRDEFCSYGPFLKGRKLRIVLKTLIPIFDCQTRLDQGEIVIRGARDEQGVAHTWVGCHE